jgi:hypothetical protein
MYSGGFWFFLVCLLFLIGWLTVYLFHKYSEWRRLPWHALLTMTLSWVTAFAYVIILCPLDLSVTLQARCNWRNQQRILQNNTLPLEACTMTDTEVASARDTLLGFWRGTFWVVSIVLGWFVMGVQGSYMASTAFTWKTRLWAAFKENIIFYGIAIIIIFPIYIYLWAAHSIDYASGFIFAVSNLYSLFIITCLMSYGLVRAVR